LDEKSLLAVLSRDVYEDPTGKIAAAAYNLGFAHLKLGVKAPNETPLGTVTAAPKPQDRELFCRNGLKWFAKIPKRKILATLKEILKHRATLLRAKPGTDCGKILELELDLAARMAEQSCRYMLWQQTLAAGKKSEARKIAREAIRQLKQIQKDYTALWPLRNKATPKHSTPFLQWRINELHSSI
jgi:hypothetical protein